MLFKRYFWKRLEIIVMKEIIVISNFHEDNPISRSNLAYNFFKSRNFNTTVLYSNFSHSLKKFRYFKNKDFKPINTIAYTSSLSLRRIFSYILFALKVLVYLKKKNPDMIYVNLPPNMLTLSVFIARKKNTKIIIDIIDLWPESFPDNGNPVLKLIISFISKIFKPIRNYAIKNSDYCIAECDYFFKKLNLSIKESSKVIHLKKFGDSSIPLNEPEKDLSIAYVGNIGNIYDFQSLITILKRVGSIRPVMLHIIGEGPEKESLLRKLQTNNINFKYHGSSFDENFKRSVISSCWFGYNGFKKNVEVGLSYKTIDYLSYGTPLLSSLNKSTDTFKLLNKNGVGINFDSEKLEEVIKEISIISESDILRMKMKALSVFKKEFSADSYFKEMDEVTSIL